MSNALIEACADRCLAKTTNENTLFRQDCGLFNFFNFYSFIYLFLFLFHRKYQFLG